MGDLKASLRDGIQHIITRLSEEMLADEDGIDYLCTHTDRFLNLLSTSESTDGDKVRPVFYSGCRGRPAIAISREQVELYLEYGFTAVKIAELFSVSVKTIFRRIAEWGIERKK